LYGSWIKPLLYVLMLVPPRRLDMLARRRQTSSLPIWTARLHIIRARTVLFIPGSRTAPPSPGYRSALEQSDNFLHRRLTIFRDNPILESAWFQSQSPTGKLVAMMSSDDRQRPLTRSPKISRLEADPHHCAALPGDAIQPGCVIELVLLLPAGPFG